MGQPRQHDFREYTNPTDIYPKGHRLLVMMDPVAETEKGGVIVKPTELIRREEMAQTDGTLVACGPFAWGDMPMPQAQPGQRVVISKYAGILREHNETKYRIIEDIEITATIGER